MYPATHEYYNDNNKINASIDTRGYFSNKSYAENGRDFRKALTEYYRYP